MSFVQFLFVEIVSLPRDDDKGKCYALSVPVEEVEENMSQFPPSPAYPSSSTQFTFMLRLCSHYTRSLPSLCYDDDFDYAIRRGETHSLSKAENQRSLVDSL